MPFLTATDGARLFYEERGRGSETVVLSHSYLLDHRHYQGQIEALAERYRVVAYDHRGHGKSDKPWRGYSMEAIYRDGLAVLDQLGIERCHWVGLSTGGFAVAAYRRSHVQRRAGRAAGGRTSEHHRGT
jgi:3-oxoadipate enol-lactonase